MTAPTDALEATTFWHAALFHEDDDEMLDVAVSYLREGLELGEAPAVALPPLQLEQVRDALGPDADQVLFVDIAVLGRNPARVLPELDAVRRSLGPSRRVRAFGSPVWPGRPERELVACHEHDALMNLALAGAPVSVLCPFDRTRLDPVVVDRARTTHPLVCEDGRWAPSPCYGTGSDTREPLDEPGPDSETVVYRAPSGPRTVRLAVAEHATRAGLDPERVADLCLAAHEIAVNTVLHSSGPGLLQLWTEETAVLCQFEDSGWIADPLAGRHPPRPADGRGYGLFLVNQLCDLVEVRSNPVDGTTVRVRMGRRGGT